MVPRTWLHKPTYFFDFKAGPDDFTPNFRFVSLFDRFGHFSIVIFHTQTIKKLFFSIHLISVQVCASKTRARLARSAIIKFLDWAEVPWPTAIQRYGVVGTGIHSKRGTNGSRGIYFQERWLSRVCRTMQFCFPLDGCGWISCDGKLTILEDFEPAEDFPFFKRNVCCRKWSLSLNEFYFLSDV